MSSSLKKRDERIDVLRGMAAFIVVLGHAFQRFGNFEGNYLFNLIFSIQMPIFMLLSGYCSSFSSKPDSFAALTKHLKKRFTVLFLPWLSWTVIGYIILHSQTPVLQFIKNTAFHMEDAFWFLFSLWCIDLVYSISSFLVHKPASKIKNSFIKTFLFLIPNAVFLAALFVVGHFVGITFLAIKYTLYYSVFYILGIFFAFIKNSNLYKSSAFITLKNVAALIFSLIYIVLTLKFSVINMPDSSIYVVIRFFISASACFILFDVIDRINVSGKIASFFKYLGTISLELYVVHVVIVSLKFINVSEVDCCTFPGFCMVILFGLALLFVSVFLIKILKLNSFADFILFGKRKIKK